MKIFYALSIILLTSLQANSQRTTPPDKNDPVTKVVKFYPNPATSYITFDIQKEEKQNFTFQIYNMLGKKVYETNNVTNRNVISLSDFYRGLYIFQLKDKSGKLIDSGKFQVSK
jgi:hypothetical protein